MQQQAITNNKDAIVHALPAGEKVNLLAQALLREFLHRKGFKQTLGVFDQECPRDEKTISSRQLMTEMMKLGKIQARSAKRQQLIAETDAAAAHAAAGDPSSSGKKRGKTQATTNGAATKPTTPSATFMELLCGYRIRKQQLRQKQQHQQSSSAASDDPALSDSSDEERALEAAAATHQRTLESGGGNNGSSKLSDIQEQKTSLQLELEKLQEREQKLIKKNKKATVGGGGAVPTDGKKAKKNKKKNGDDPAGGGEEGGDFSPPRSRGRHNNNGISSSSGAGGGSGGDPLDVAMGRMSSLPISSTAHGGGGAAVGRNWTPGGGTAGGTGRGGLLGNIPEIGLNGGTGAMATLGAGMDRPPSFVAGQGMNLMGGGNSDRGRTQTTKEWEAPTAAAATRKNSFGHFPSEEDDDDVPSPYRSIGQTPYDHGATRPGILRGAGASNNNNNNVTAAGGGVPGGIMQHTSSSNAPDNLRRRESFDRTPSFGSIDGKSPPSTSHSPRGGSPTLNNSGTGFGFHVAAQQQQQTSSSNGGAASSHRTSRRVTIIVDP
ncbi:Hypothetical protein, putative [Bodo saltans]|uniref:MINDY4 N-terminal dimerisation domain-containing protein n=1 Tax=Bodo saltans TaxID=75058 RepID=A0A0S4J6I4_BODSA|nr:Hypothetical protein, putative [Bodo saltans]|eukprot:CUG87053.1 Hypothetical protein, putative [Bodo saltans]